MVWTEFGRSLDSLDTVVRDFIAQAERAGQLAPQTGIALSVVHQGEIKYQGAFGLRDRAKLLPVTTKTVFDVGSLTKSMTAAALMKAHEKRQLDLNEPLLILDLRTPHRGEVTLADVLSHRTGLPAHDLLWYFGSYAPGEIASRLRHLELVPHAFRNGFIYNNLLYGLTRLVVEDVLHRSWESHITDELLTPLSMNATTFSECTAADSNEALPYVGQKLTKRKDGACIAPAMSQRSDLEDMTTWSLCQLGQRNSILSERALHTMHEAKISAADLNPLLLSGLEWLGSPSYGYGWFLGATGGAKAVFHMGFVDGFSSLMVLLPSLSLGFVVLCNANFSAFPGNLVHRLVAGLAGRELRHTATVASTVLLPDAPQIQPPAALEGAYVDPAYGRIDVARAADGLRLNYCGYEWPLRFHERGKANFDVTAFGLQIPLSAEFGTDRVTIPFALDPRAPPQVFARMRSSSPGNQG